MPIRKKFKKAPTNTGEKFTLEGTELGSLVKEVTEAYGEHVARQLSRQVPYDIRIPSGILSLDLSLAGGFLISRGSMIYGEKSSGKSTTAVRIIRNAQLMFPDKAAVYVDVEGTFDPTWFMKLGGDPDRLIVVEPETGEHAVDIADAAVRSKESSIIVTDSIAMLTPMKEIEQSAEDSLPGVHARLVGNFLRRIQNAMLKERHRGHKPLILHINQFRMKIGGYGDPRTLPGGKALEFATSQQVEMKNKEITETTDNPSVKYNEHEFKITKDKTGGRVRGGKFFMVRDPKVKECEGLPEGFISQGKSTIARANEVGMMDGHTMSDRRGKIIGKYSGGPQLNQEMLTDPAKGAFIMMEVIQANRKLWGLPTFDGQ